VIQGPGNKSRNGGTPIGIKLMPGTRDRICKKDYRRCVETSGDRFDERASAKGRRGGLKKQTARNKEGEERGQKNNRKRSDQVTQGGISTRAERGWEKKHRDNGADWK